MRVLSGETEHAMHRPLRNAYAVALVHASPDISEFERTLLVRNLDSHNCNEAGFISHELVRSMYTFIGDPGTPLDAVRPPLCCSPTASSPFLGLYCTSVRHAPATAVACLVLGIFPHAVVTQGRSDSETQALF